MARDKVLTIKVSSEEKDRIVKAAGHDKRTYSDWARLALDAACKESEVRHREPVAPGGQLGYLREEEQATAAA